MNFDRSNSGIQAEFPMIDDDADEMDYFQAFFDDEVMKMIYEQTNLFHEFEEECSPIHYTSTSKMRKWSDVEMDKLYLFFAVVMLMSQIKKKAAIRDYWIVEDVTATPIFGKYMSRDRFLAILGYLHFVDNRTEEERKADRLENQGCVYSSKGQVHEFFFRVPKAGD